MGWAVDRTKPDTELNIAVTLGNDVVAVVQTGGTRPDLEKLFGKESNCVFEFHAATDTLDFDGLLSATVISDTDALNLKSALEARDKEFDYYVISIESAVGSESCPKTVLPYSKSIIDTVNLKNEIIQKLQYGARKTFFEITDLILYLKHHNTVTGIQRVECGVINGILSLDRFSEINIEFGSISENNSRITVFDVAEIRSLIEVVFSGSETVQQLTTRIASMYENSIKIKPTRGDAILILGAYWIIPNIENRIHYLKSLGVKIGTFVYDIIPISSPQWVENLTAIVFVERAPGVISLSDYLIAISEYVKQDVTKLINAELGVQKPVGVTPLPHIVGNKINSSFKLSPDLARVTNNQYVLCVGTLEIRKNHFLLYRIWARLIREHGWERVPALVLVGRWGWRMDDFKEACDRSNFLNRKIVVLSGVNDDELTYLYQNCLLTVFPSFTEGWGLPVGESLHLGKMCIASATSSIPEVGGVFADYIDPYDFHASYQVVEKAIFDDGFRREREELIRSEFSSRSWIDLALNLLDVMQNSIKESENQLNQTDLFPPLINEKQVYDLNGLSRSEAVSWKDKNVRFCFVDGWHQLEHWGAWGARPNSIVSFKTEADCGSKVRVWLRLVLPNEYKNEEIRLITNCCTRSLANKITNKESRWLSVDAVVDQNRCVFLTFQRPRHNCSIDGNREIYVGVSGIVFCKADDLTSVNEVLTKFLEDDI
jgi:glycosyltransferase involved in cell wall biosynthesis